MVFLFDWWGEGCWVLGFGGLVFFTCSIVQKM